MEQPIDRENHCGDQSNMDDTTECFEEQSADDPEYNQGNGDQYQSTHLSTSFNMFLLHGLGIEIVFH